MPSCLQLRRRTPLVLALLGVGALAGVRGVAQEGNPSANSGGGSQRFVEPSTPARDGGGPPGESLAPIVVPFRAGTSLSADPLELERQRMLQGWNDPLVEPQTIYFPPAPPVLGAPLPPMGLYSDEIARSLAPYVAEPFYAPLSTRLAEEDLGRRLRARLDAYREQKLSLLVELRARLESLRHADAPTRRQSLLELGAAQTPELVALEKTADELRREFFRAHFLGGGGDWNRYRSWRLSTDERQRERPGAKQLELRVLRAAEFYQEGLSPAQRRLLREVVMDRAATMNLPGAGLGFPADEPVRVCFFSPDTARLAVPDDLPVALASALAQYTREKDALKHELAERIIALDADRNATRRARALQDLADEQTARLAGLEELAEKIRADLAPVMAGLSGPTPNPLPAGVARRLGAYVRGKNELQKIAQDRLAHALAQFDREDHEGDPAGVSARRVAVVRTTVEAFHAEHAAAIAALNVEAEALRGEIAQLTPGPAPGPSGRSVDALLGDFSRAFKRQQLASLYADYRHAVLVPGLSPEQRRLLLAGAMVDLKLPGAIRDRQVLPSEVWRP